jgi:5'-3' exonuclease
LTLLISKTSTKQAFLVMKIAKIRLCDKMNNDFLTNSLVLYIEREIAKSFDLDSILDDFFFFFFFWTYPRKGMVDSNL